MPRTIELRDAKGLEIMTRSGRLVVIAEPNRVNIEVEGLLEQSRKRQVWREHGRLHIRSARAGNALTVRCPIGTDLSACSQSGSVELRGDLGDVRALSQSGRIQVDRARSVEARTKNGRIEIQTVHGRVSMASASGAVEVEQAARARAATISGRIKLERVTGAVDAMSVSGSVRVETLGAGDIRVGTVSGGVDIRVPRDRRPQVTTRRKSGRLSVDCEEGDDLSVTVATVSGSVRIGNHRQAVIA